ncbi:MAG: hypothetical protein VYB72_13070, partial [Planctomycetota bacterium]|nr:hypothetical protein [Planctomycetota bacterium]
AMLPLRGNPDSESSLEDTSPPAATSTDSLSESANNPLRVSLFGRDNPVAVGDPIRFRLQILNETSARDSDLKIEFRLPDGLRLERVSRSTNPEVGEFQIGAGALATASVPSIEPGEQLDYEIVLVGNLPQTFDFTIKVESYRSESSISKSVTTRVTP